MRSGAIIALTDEGVVGWAIDHEQPGAHFRVVLLANGRPLGVQMTADEKGALVKAACGEIRPSFTIAVQAEEELQFPVELELRDTEGTLLGPSLTVQQSEHIDPKTFRLSALAYEGFCDRETDGRREGWIWNLCIPQLPVILEVMVETETVDFIKADRFRPDLMEAGKRDGSCSFSVAVPPPNVTNPEIILRIVGTTFHLQHLNKDAHILSLQDNTQVTAIEQQLLSMGGGHPSTVHPETSGTNVQYVMGHESMLQAFEARLREALREQGNRLDRQESILAATRGTIDNLVRTWLQIQNEVALLRADLAAFHEHTGGAFTKAIKSAVVGVPLPNARLQKNSRKQLERRVGNTQKKMSLNQPRRPTK
jgi:hypothetical protein